MSEIIYIGVGSNIDQELNILKALDLLRGEIQISAISTCYHSKAIGRPEQNDVINCVWQAITDFDAETVKFKILHDIETLLGRVRTDDRYADRPIDLDILLYGDHCINTERITIPDPEILHRNFIAIPLQELAPDITIPGTHHLLADQLVARDKDGLTELTNLTAQLKQRILNQTRPK